MGHDLVVRGGTVLDGTGAPRFQADIGVDAGRITSIGRIIGRGADEIDADGLFVAPGFIDGHTHLDAQVNWDHLGTSLCYHGVTTAIMGNCGFTLAPCDEPHKDLVLRSLERAEDIPRAAMLAGIRWNWESFPQYLDALETIPKGINYAVHIGHSSLRAHVMGERAFTEQATEADLATMRLELVEAIRAGAIGFSTSRSLHMTSDGRPVPSRLAEWSEVQQLVGAMGELGAGLFQLDHEKHDPGPGRVEYFERLSALAASSGRPMFFMLVVPESEPDFWVDRLELLDAAASRGGRIYAQVHSREMLNLRGFETIFPFDDLPVWKEFRRLPLTDQRRGLEDAELRNRLAQAVEANASTLTVNAKGRPLDFAAMCVIDRPIGPFRSVADIAAERSISPIAAILDLVRESDLRQLFATVNFNRDPESVLSLLRHPRTIVGISDAGAHVDHISDYSIPTHLLAHWVRDKEAFEWEAAIAMLTSVPANRYGISGRGTITEGLAADLAVFDPATIGPAMPVITRDFPAGATRVQQAATGMAATVVNGEVLLREGIHSGSLAGRLLRGPLAGRRHQDLVPSLS